MGEMDTQRWERWWTQEGGQTQEVGGTFIQFNSRPDNFRKDKSILKTILDKTICVKNFLDFTSNFTYFSRMSKLFKIF